MLLSLGVPCMPASDVNVDVARARERAVRQPGQTSWLSVVSADRETVHILWDVENLGLDSTQDAGKMVQSVSMMISEVGAVLV